MVTIKQRLAIGFTVLIGLTIGLICYSILTMGDIQERVNMIVEVSAKRVDLAEKVKKNILQFSLYEKNVILARSKEAIEQQIILADRYTEVIDKSLGALNQVVSDGQGRYLEDFLGAWGGYLLTVKEVNRLVREETRARAKSLSENEGNEAFEATMETLVSMKEELNQQGSSDLTIYESSYREKFNNILENIEAHIYALKDKEEEIIFSVGGNISEENLKEMNDSIAYLERYVAEAVSHANKDENDSTRWLKEAVNKYIKIHRQIIELHQRNSLEMAHALSVSEGDQKLKQAMDLLDIIIAENESQMRTEQSESRDQYYSSRNFLVIVLIFVSLTTAAGGFLLARSIVQPLNSLINTTKRLASGDTKVRSSVGGDNEVGVLAESFNTMAATIDERVWLQTALNQIANSMRGSQNVVKLAKNVITTLAEVLGIGIGAIYIMRENRLSLSASFSYQTRTSTINSFALGEGLVGQAALERKQLIFNDVAGDEHDYIIRTGISETQVNHILVQPLIFNDAVLGVIVLGKTSVFDAVAIDFILQAAENIAIAVEAADSHIRQAELLQATQKQAAELHHQQLQLADANSELEHKTKTLEDSQSQLRLRGEDLENINAELERQTELLEEQKQQIEKAMQEVEIKAEELEQASKYKSEFLANMSHELRTPLNSLLLLSKTLSKNSQGNFTEQQVESLNIIHTGGQDLLCLINDILDLSKVEAGKLEVYFEPLSVKILCDELRTLFQMLMKDKGIEFNIVIEPSVPSTFISDKKRITQIIRNFLSNAFKFTHEGTIELRVGLAPEFTRYSKSRLSEKDIIFIAVKDSGIGIPAEQQNHIFEAFQQADGSTSRKYGGTGLGLAISRQLSQLLNGEIHLTSEAGKGSTFTLYLPLASRNQELSVQTYAQLANSTSIINNSSNGVAEIAETTSKFKVEDDRDNIQLGDSILLIIEDDIRFSRIMMNMAHARNYKCIRANDGLSGIKLAKQFRPKAITLDIGLPDMAGNQVLTQLKADADTKSIPVHVITADDRTHTKQIMIEGAQGYLSKPIGPEDLDVIFGSVESQTQYAETIEGEVLREQQLNLKNKDQYGGQTIPENNSSHSSSQSSSHTAATNLGPQDLGVLSGKRVLIVDDDIRNMFALSEIMRDQGMTVVKADNGELALKKLAGNEEVDIVLMDIMMPVMDGYQATREIRKLARCELLPIIAITAKAMPNDREMCLAAGATEYLTKPIDESKLLGMMGRLLT